MPRKLARKGIKRRLRSLVNNYKILSTSWHVQTRLFFEQSTLHGVRYIAESGRPFIERFMWFACVAIGAVATTVIILSLWEKFQTNPTITGLDTDFHNWNVPFPAITVCPEMPSNLTLIEDYVDGMNLDAGILPKYAINLIVYLTQLSYDRLEQFKTAAKNIDKDIVGADVKLKEFVFGLMNRCEDIFDTCEFKSYRYNCCDGFFPVFTERGFCYTFNSRHYERKLPWSEAPLPEFNMEYIKETDIKWALQFTVKNTDVKMPIYILNSDEEAGLDIQPQHIWDFKINKISFSVKQTYTTEDTRQLSIKQRHCVFEDEIRLKIDHIYTYTACTQQCRMDNAMKRCKCVPHFYPDKNPYYRHCGVKELHCIYENLKQIKSVDHCGCQLGCSNTVYEVEKLNNDENLGVQDLETQFVSWPMVRYKREVLFGWVDLLVSFGGIAGLFLGFSLLSGVELLYYFIIRACCMAIREREELKRIQQDEISKAGEDYDLSLVPYIFGDPYPGNGINEVAKAFYHDNLCNNKIAPLNQNKWKPADVILPPFGIEFLN